MRRFAQCVGWRATMVAVTIGVLWAGSMSLARADEQLIIEVLERADCAHCENERAFLEELTKSRRDIVVRFYDVEGEGEETFQKVTMLEGLPRATPVTLAGGRILQGFDAPETTGKRIVSLAESSRGKEQITFDRYLENSSGEGSGAERIAGASCDDGTVCEVPPSDPMLFRLPILGAVVDVSSYSLPTLSAVLGFIDGFNPCAMWVLITFLIVLAQTKSRKRMVQIAGLFILAETVMYYLILNVWFTAWDFIGLDRIVTPIVGLVAIGGGIFFLYEWYKSLGTEMACQIVDAENRSKIVQKIKSFIDGDFTLLVAFGVIGLAFTVNVIEFACSIGIPQAFTKILELNQLGFLGTQSLMVVYIFFYMIDDLLVFGLAVWGFDKLHLTEKYSRWSTLAGGLLMLLLGYLLAFRPDIISQMK